MVIIGYWDKEEWKHFISEYLIPLRDSSKRLLEFWDQLKVNADGVSFDKIESDKELKMVLLGGIDQNGGYSDRSLAKFYKTFFGVSISKLHEYLIGQTEGITPQVSAMVEESKFVVFIKNIYGKTDTILESAHRNGLIIITDSNTQEIGFKELLEDPEKIAEMVKKFYDDVLKMTANYNQHTLFLWTIRKITRRYLEAAYPELDDEGKFVALKSITGLEEYFVPEIAEKTENDKKMKRDYTVWHLPENSFGGMVCGLNEIVWKYHDPDSSMGLDFVRDMNFLFENVINLKNDFVKEAEKSLDSVKWEFSRDCRYFFDGSSAISLKIYSGNSNGFYYVGNTSIFEVFDAISQGLFFGLVAWTIKYPGFQYELNAVGRTKGLYLDHGINDWRWR